MDNRSQLILDKLKSKGSLKQSIYTHTLDVFNQLKTIAEGTASELAIEMQQVDEKVVVEYFSRGDFEFHLKFGGDTLVFQMHSNIVKLNPKDPIIQQSYVTETPENGFFGTIRVYNFLSDSIRYNRIQDQGVLMARLLINRELHFHIEAPNYFEHIKPNIERNKVEEKHLRYFIQSAMISAIDGDLIAPSYQNIQLITWQQQQMNNQGKAGSKLGFQMHLEE